MVIRYESTVYRLPSASSIDCPDQKVPPGARSKRPWQEMLPDTGHFRIHRLDCLLLVHLLSRIVVDITPGFLHLTINLIYPRQLNQLNVFELYPPNRTTLFRSAWNN